MITEPTNPQPSDRRTVITIGNFDGVHQGHRAIVREARRIADSQGLPVHAVTFAPHPAAILRPGSEPLQVSDLTERIALLEQSGVDRVVVLKPTPQLLGLSAAQFVRHLVDVHAPAAIVEGGDFRFGSNRSGDMHRLRELCDPLGIAIHEVAPVSVALQDQLEVQVSSTRVRWLLEHGRVADAARCLGRPFTLRGSVVKGDQRGRTIQVPTMNLCPAAMTRRAIPSDGVYFGEVSLSGNSQPNSDAAASRSTYPAAISIGIKPTFDGKRRVVEAHLLNFSPEPGVEAYGTEMTVRFVRWHRGQHRFADVGELTDQLKRDIAALRSLVDNDLLNASSTMTTTDA